MENIKPRYLTEHIPGIGGRIKVQPADFQVEEIPLYEPCGEGEHTYLRVEKTGISTFEAVRKIAQALGLSPADVGYAGLKDARAVTRQTLSVPRVPPEEALRLDLPEVRVLWAKRHRNKLKVGHLVGNRFTIRVREVGPEALPLCQAVLAVLSRRGVPNFFDIQRFGRRGNTHLMGQALVRDDPETLLSHFLGRPHPSDTPQIQEARARFDAGDWPGALECWPSEFPDERMVLQALIQRKGNAQQALRILPRRLVRFLVSAYQSALFNQILNQRLQELDQIQVGDLAYKHDNGAVFLVETPPVEQLRAERFEISPSGPLFGYRMPLAQGRPGALERRVLAEEGLTLESFRFVRGFKAVGARRSLRFPLEDVSIAWDETEDCLVLGFTLPAGCYATRVLAEIMKTDEWPEMEEAL